MMTPEERLELCEQLAEKATATAPRKALEAAFFETRKRNLLLLSDEDLEAEFRWEFPEVI